MSYLVIELWNNQESSPSSHLLALDNISKYVISHIEDILPFGPNKTGEYLAVSPTVHNVLLILVTDLIFANVQLTRLLIDTP